MSEDAFVSFKNQYRTFDETMQNKIGFVINNNDFCTLFGLSSQKKERINHNCLPTNNFQPPT